MPGRRRLPDVGLQFARFALVGVANTLVSFAVYDALLAFSVSYPAGAAVAFAAGAVNGYLLNRGWTFNASDSARARLRYVVVQAGGLALTTGLLSLLVRAGSLGEAAGYAATLPLVTTATFLANRTWVFARARRTSPPRTRNEEGGPRRAGPSERASSRAGATSRPARRPRGTATAR